MRRCFAVCLLCCFPCITDLGAQSPDSDTPDSEAEIREVGLQYVAAFNAGDAKQLASFWSPEAVYINRVTGEQVTGRDAIAKEFEGLFGAEGEEKLNIDVESIQFVSPNVAVEHGVANFISSANDPVQVPYSAVYIRRQGKWLLDRVTDKETVVAKSNYGHLRDLQWMIGSWVDQDDQVRIETTCSWTKNQNFITRSFTVSTGGDVQMSGMQIIGWDADAKQIRSWTFDSEGGFSQGKWSKSGDQWHIHKQGKTADGKPTGAVNRIQLVDGDSFKLQSTRRTLDGKILPNIDEVLVVRQ